MVKLQDKDFKRVSGGNSEDIQEYKNLLTAYQEERERLSYKLTDLNSPLTGKERKATLEALDNLNDMTVEAYKKLLKVQSKN